MKSRLVTVAALAALALSSEAASLVKLEPRSVIAGTAQGQFLEIAVFTDTDPVDLEFTINGSLVSEDTGLRTGDPNPRRKAYIKIPVTLLQNVGALQVGLFGGNALPFNVISPPTGLSCRFDPQNATVRRGAPNQRVELRLLQSGIPYNGDVLVTVTEKDDTAPASGTKSAIQGKASFIIETMGAFPIGATAFFEATVPGTSARCAGSFFGGCSCFLDCFDLVDIRSFSRLEMDDVRRFRDKVLRPDEALKHYVDAYYRFSPELVRIGLSHPHIASSLMKLVGRSMPELRALSGGKPTQVQQADLAEALRVAGELDRYASEELRAFLKELRRDLGNAPLLAGIGVTVQPAQPRVELASVSPLHFEPAAHGPGYLASRPGYQLVLAPTEARLLGRSSNTSVRLAGARANASAQPEEQLAARSHYLSGSDPAHWRPNVPHYAQVRYNAVYPGIDVVYYGRDGELEFDFVLAPQADPRLIALRFGEDSVPRLENGALHLEDGLRLKPPVAYQNIAGKRVELAAAYVRHSDGSIGFSLGRYDRSQPLVIDPVVNYASYLGGAKDETATAVAVDAQGNRYLAGMTKGGLAAAIPLGAGGGMDAFVTKLSPTGAVLYTAYIGGDGDDGALGIDVDGQGNVYLTGGTTSTNFPTRLAAQPAFGGAGTLFGSDAFVLKLNPAGSDLVYSTYLGGAKDDGGRGIRVDATGAIVLVGATASANFPTRNPLQAAIYPGGTIGSDAFVTKLNAAGALVYSTYLGGEEDDAAAAVALDAAGRPWITGATYSEEFPVVNYFQQFLGGDSDAFLTRLNAAGSTIEYSTFLGGDSDDAALSIALNAAGEAHIAGVTGSGPDFPRAQAAQGFGNPEGLFADAFVTKFAADGRSLRYSTFLGGSQVEMASGLALDASGNAYVVGTTSSTNLPVTTDAMQPAAGGKLDSFLTKLSPDGQVRLTTYLGGGDQDIANAVAVRGAETIVAGATASTDLSVITVNAGQPTLTGAKDLWIANIDTNLNGLTVVSAASYAVRVAPDSIASAFGKDFATQTTSAPFPWPASLDGIVVTVTDSTGASRPASIIFTSPTLVNFVLPPATALGPGSISITRNGVIVAKGLVKIEKVAPAIFTANASSQGPAAALFLRVSANNTQTQGNIFHPSTLAAVPVSLGTETDKLFLILFGTGVRGGQQVTATIGGVTVPVAYAGPQGTYEAFDQLNLGPLPRSLVGRGEVPIVITVDGVNAKPVTVAIQ